LVAKGDAKALDAARKATELDGKRVKSWMIIGKQLASSEDPKEQAEAAEAYGQAARAGGKVAGPALLNQGLGMARMGKDAKALETLEKASKLEGGEAAERSLCVLYSKAGDSKKAMAACQGAASHGGRAEDWYNLSFAQQKLGKGAEARKSLQSALKA